MRDEDRGQPEPSLQAAHLELHRLAQLAVERAERLVEQQQAVYATELGYPGLNLESLNYVDAKVKPYLPTQYVDKQFWISDEWYAENGNKAVELWNAWMLKKA